MENSGYTKLEIDVFIAEVAEIKQVLLSLDDSLKIFADYIKRLTAIDKSGRGF